MNFTSRLLLSITSIGLLGSGFWVVLMPHILFQYIAIVGASTLFGGAVFAITDNGEDDPEVAENIQRLKQEEIEEESKNNVLEQISQPLITLQTNSDWITNPSISRKFYRICDIGKKINQYGYDNNCMDKLLVWNTVYVNKVASLVDEYNTIVKIPDPTTRIVRKIDEFGSLAHEIMDKFEKQYDDLISGKIESFDTDMTLVKQLHKM